MYITLLIDFHCSYLEVLSNFLSNDGFDLSQVFHVEFLDKLIFQPVWAILTLRSKGEIIYIHFYNDEYTPLSIGEYV